MRKIMKGIGGEAGVGTLIIFIAMVLVAAVAAAVLIATAGMLQQQAQSTGMEATQDVSGGIEIISVIGDRCEDGVVANPDNGDIMLLELSVSLHSGSQPIDLETMVITVTDGATTADLVFEPDKTASDDADAQYYAATPIRDLDGSFITDTVITRGDLIKITICTENDITGLELGPNTDVKLTLIPDAGSQTIEKFYTPPTYTTRYIKMG